MSAQFFELLGEFHVVAQAVFRPAGIEQVARIADGRFAHRTGLEYRVDRDAHVFDGIERIEDAEDVDPLRVGFAHEFADHVVGIRGVAHGVGAAKQHLEADVGNVLPHFAQPLPRIFVQEAHGGVEGRSTPHFQAEQAGEALRHGARRGQQVVRSHARCQQRLMCVAEGRVCEQQALLVARPLREAARPKLPQQLARARWRGRLVAARKRRRGECRWNRLALHLRVAVQDDVADVGEQLRCAVAALREAKQFERLVEKRSRGVPGAQARMIDHVFEQRNIRLYTADAKFTQRAVHAVAGPIERHVPCRDFHQQRIVIRRKRGAGVRRAAVQTNAEARRRPVRRDPAIVRREVVSRVFRGDAALQRVAIERHRLLLGRERAADRAAGVPARSGSASAPSRCL